MEGGLSRRGCGAGSEQGLERFIEIRGAVQFPRCVLAILSVQKKDGSAQGFRPREKDMLPLSQRPSFNGVENAVNGEDRVDKAAWKRSETAHHAMRLLKLDFFKHLHGFLEKNILYVREDDKLFECSTVQ